MLHTEMLCTCYQLASVLKWMVGPLRHKGALQVVGKPVDAWYQQEPQTLTFTQFPPPIPQTCI